MIVYNAHAELCEWVHIGIFGFSYGYNGKSKAIGHIIDGKLVAAVRYDNLQARKDGTFYSVEMSIYSVDKRWATRVFLNKVFAYPFIQLGLERVQITTSVVNEGVNSLVSRLGFIKEGTHRKAHFSGGDCYSWSMLKDECRWI